ncbi:hypothetical protein RUM44_001486 [Polyplax serrata]|uniref:Uncharacterized protein n=1 Tax=Polyplax serrata TaxID=468196 RepID=A0ABR1AKE9_POLSC
MADSKSAIKSVGTHLDLHSFPDFYLLFFLSRSPRPTILMNGTLFVLQNLSPNAAAPWPLKVDKETAGPNEQKVYENGTKVLHFARLTRRTEAQRSVAAQNNDINNNNKQQISETKEMTNYIHRREQFLTFPENISPNKRGLIIPE